MADVLCVKAMNFNIIYLFTFYTVFYKNVNL